MGRGVGRGRRTGKFALHEVGVCRKVGQFSLHQVGIYREACDRSRTVVNISP